jgi:hypothetical protein
MNRDGTRWFMLAVTLLSIEGIALGEQTGRLAVGEKRPAASEHSQLPAEQSAPVAPSEPSQSAVGGMGLQPVDLGGAQTIKLREPRKARPDGNDGTDGDVARRPLALGQRESRPIPVDDSLEPHFGRRLAHAHVARVVRKKKPGLRDCYNRYAAHVPQASGNVEARFTIEPHGRVGRVEIEADGVSDPRLATCMRRQIRRWRFPTAEVPTSAVQSFVFHVAGASGHR